MREIILSGASRGIGRALALELGRRADTRLYLIAHPDVDFLVLHPGVVRTDLDARTGLFGKLLATLKRGWEKPGACAARLVATLDVPRWSSPGQASWYFEDQARPWPIWALAYRRYGAMTLHCELIHTEAGGRRGKLHALRFVQPRCKTRQDVHGRD